MNEDGMILFDHYLNAPMKGFNTIVMKKEHWNNLKLEMELLKNTLKNMENTIGGMDVYIDSGDIRIVKNMINHILIILGEKI